MRKNIVYFSYDSFSEPISQSQIIPLINKLSKIHNVTAVSFEKGEIKRKLFKKEINWIIIKFNKIKIYRLFGLFYSLKILSKNLSRNQSYVFISRSYISCWITLFLKFFFKIKIIADIRGFWLDEKYETGKISYLNFKFLKIFERYIFKNSDFLITLSNESRKYLIKKYKIKKNKIKTIYTFANKKFDKKKKKRKIIHFGYIGNLGMHYEFKKVINFLNFFENINKKWLLFVFNNYNQRINISKYKINFPKKKIILKSIKFENMHTVYKNIDIAIFFLKKSFSKIASCPTKVSELFCSNTPFITNTNIGDINFFKKNNQNKIFLLENFNNQNVRKVYKNFLRSNNKLNNIKYKKMYQNYFEENTCIEKYKKIVEKL